MSDKVSHIASSSRSLFGAERQQVILNLINQGQVIGIAELASRFDVSQETIRRDIKALEEVGQVRRLHGGVAPIRTVDSTARRPVKDRMVLDRDAKIQAARASLAIFEDDMNVFLSASSTTAVLAEELANSGLKLRVSTTMVDIAIRLADAPGVKVSLIGGDVEPRTHTTVGPEVIRALERRVFDIGVCGVSAINLSHGFLGPTSLQCIYGEILSKQAHRIMYVADSSKFGRSDAHIISPLNAAAAVATDQPPPHAFVTAFDAYGVAVLLPPEASPFSEID